MCLYVYICVNTYTCMNMHVCTEPFSRSFQPHCSCWYNNVLSTFCLGTFALAPAGPKMFFPLLSSPAPLLELLSATGQWGCRGDPGTPCGLFFGDTVTFSPS